MAVDLRSLPDSRTTHAANPGPSRPCKPRRTRSQPISALAADHKLYMVPSRTLSLSPAGAGANSPGPSRHFNKLVASSGVLSRRSAAVSCSRAFWWRDFVLPGTLPLVLELPEAACRSHRTSPSGACSPTPPKPCTPIPPKLLGTRSPKIPCSSTFR